MRWGQPWEAGGVLAADRLGGRLRGRAGPAAWLPAVWEWLTVPWGKVLGRGEAGGWPKQLAKGGAPLLRGTGWGWQGRSSGHF